MRSGVPGVATGLAWTPVGGDILFVEAARTPGAGRLILTGQLGEVMKESAQAALSLVKARAGELGVEPGAFEKSDIHIHVPAGATPKDGPSAGVAIFVALASLLTGRTVRSDIAMTGEISLRGLVLPIGGVKEKVLAALRAGITTVMLPARNRRDLDEIPADARDKLKFVWVEQVDRALSRVPRRSFLARCRASRLSCGTSFRPSFAPRPQLGLVALKRGIVQVEDARIAPAPAAVCAPRPRRRGRPWIIVRRRLRHGASRQALDRAWG